MECDLSWLLLSYKIDIIISIYVCSPQSWHGHNTKGNGNIVHAPTTVFSVLILLPANSLTELLVMGLHGGQFRTR